MNSLYSENYLLQLKVPISVWIFVVFGCLLQFQCLLICVNASDQDKHGFQNEYLLLAFKTVTSHVKINTLFNYIISCAISTEKCDSRY